MPDVGQEADLPFPLGGVDESLSAQRQPRLTCPAAVNVRGRDWTTDRARGASRPGLSRYCPDQINVSSGLANPYSIQDINALILGDGVVGVPDPAAGRFVYSLGTNGLGFGLGSPAAGASYFTQAGPGSKYAFECSCWDSEGNAYVSELDSEAGEVIVTAVDSDGSGSQLWQTNPVIGNAASRVTGMVVSGPWLYVAVFHGLSPLTRIWRFSRLTGDLIGGTHWVSSSTVSGLTSSSLAVNCLAAAGKYIGVVSRGTASNADDNFFVLDRESGGVVASTGSQGTAANVACRVDSDGTYFYAAICTTTKQVQKITTAGVVLWTHTAADDDNTLCYDRFSNRVFVLGLDTGAVRAVHPETGVLLSSFTAASSTAWDNIDADWQGNVFLWADGAGSNDVASIDSTLTTRWVVTLANAPHQGASVSRGDPSAARPRGRLLVVAGGRLSIVTRLAATPVVTPSRWSPSVPRLFSAQNGFFMYYADGAGYFRYNPFTNAAEAWTTTTGSLPSDSRGWKARLIELWRGRTMLSGLPGDPQNWFASRMFDPLDYNYAPGTINDFKEAVAGNNSRAGLVGDIVNTMIPFSDDVLIFGCDHTIWAMTGDPASGGSIDNVSEITGVAWGRPWCMDPEKTVYFFGNRGGVYTYRPGQRANPAIGSALPRRFRDIDTGANAVRMAWDDACQGLHLFVCPLLAPGATEHFFWDARSNAWWPVELAKDFMDPKCCYAYDGDSPDDRVVLIGSWDSYVRAIDADVGKDDDYPFDSSVTIGPILPGDQGEVMLHEVQATLARESSGVTFEVLVGRSAEAALASEPVFSGTWAASRNFTDAPRRSGYAVFIRIRASGKAWQLEQLRLRLSNLGPVRRRSV